MIALNVRSAFPKDVSGVLPDHPCDTVSCNKVVKDKTNGDSISTENVVEIDYCSVLNRVLPLSIRAISWK